MLSNSLTGTFKISRLSAELYLLMRKNYRFSEKLVSSEGSGSSCDSSDSNANILSRDMSNVRESVVVMQKTPAEENFFREIPVGCTNVRKR